MKISGIHSVNDPCELIGFDLSDVEQRMQLLGVATRLLLKCVFREAWHVQWDTDPSG